MVYFIDICSSWAVLPGWLGQDFLLYSRGAHSIIQILLTDTFDPQLPKSIPTMQLFSHPDLENSSTPETWALMWLSMHQHIKTISLSSCFTRFHCLQEESHLSWDTNVILKHCMRKCSTTTKLSLQQMICTESLNTVLTKIMEEEM